MDLLDRLLGHDRWTTRQVLLRCREVDEAGLRQEFDIGHRTIEATLIHMIANVRTWTDLMNGDPAAGTLAWDGLDLDQLGARYETAAADLAALARWVRDEDRLDELWLDTLDDPPTAKTNGGAIAHVLTHTMHHRGEVLHMLQRLGLTDLPEGDVLSWEAATRAETRPARLVAGP